MNYTNLQKTADIASVKRDKELMNQFVNEFLEAATNGEYKCALHLPDKFYPISNKAPYKVIYHFGGGRALIVKFPLLEYFFNNPMD